MRVHFIVFDCVRRSGLKQGFGHSRLPIVFIDLTMAKRATPGVDVFIDWGTLRWGGACNWYPGFSPGTHKESTHTENDPTNAAESEAGLRLHIGAPKTANRARTTWALERSWRVISFGVDSGASSGPAFPSYGPEGRTSAVTLSLGIGQCKGGTRCPNLFKTNRLQLMMWSWQIRNPEDQFERESRFHQLTGEKSPLHSKWPSKGGFERKRLVLVS